MVYAEKNGANRPVFPQERKKGGDKGSGKGGSKGGGICVWDICTCRTRLQSGFFCFE